MGYSGKRDDATAWQFVFNFKAEDAFGECATRLLNGTGYGPTVWTSLEEWQRVYVQETDKAMHGLMLACITRDTVTGKALMQEIMNNTYTGKSIGQRPQRLLPLG